MFAIFGIVFLSIVCFSEQFSLIPSFFSKKTISDRPLLLDEATFSVKNLSAVDDTKLTAPELIEKYGYNGEVHLLTTDDGYVLELHRISGGPKSPPRPGKKVVYLQHGLVFSSASFVLSGPDHAISYKLADEGYDVWMGNSRGSLYSMNHTIHESLGCSKNRKGFWAFSLDEIGYYDLPASIDYVLNHTGESKVHYIGHSQGTTAFFIMASERPEYQNKIQTMHAMAPAVFLTHMTSPLMRLATQLTTQIHYVRKLFPLHYMYPWKMHQKICRDIRPMQTVCLKALSFLMGHTDQINKTLIPTFFGHLPTGAGTNQLIHFSQWWMSGQFRKFDYGRAENLKHYNSATPPDYKLENTTVPVSLYYGQNDAVTVVEDVKILAKQLPNVINDYLVPHKEFNHVDFIWGKDARRLVYDEIIKTMRLREIN